ncbi:MAG TPA: WcaI family glycosyltransferase [Burkholderiales bacterium]|nr:WcaI family glycosyltransferase [Burkholderiales bacterium]
MNRSAPPGAASRIAIVGINYAPELTGIGVYSTGMAEYLAAQGNAVDVYTGFAYYPQWRKAPEDEGRLYRFERRNGVNVRRHFVYVPAKPRALTRMLHELSFVFSASLGYLFGPRAAVTFVVSPPLPLGLPVGLIAKLKRSRVVFHVQDLQPDAAIETGLLKPGWFTRALLGLERSTYALADRVSTISRGMLARIEAKGVAQAKTLMFVNWANDDLVGPRGRDTEFRDRWQLGERFVVLYSGNLGVKQGLDMLLDCAALMREERDLVFLIVGEGAAKPALLRRVQAERLENVQLRPLQPPELLSELLATASVAAIPQLPGVGDIVLPSKLCNILAAERAVIAAAYNTSELSRILREAGCGLTVPPGDAGALAEALRRLKANPLELARYAANGRRYMQERLSRTAVLPRVSEAVIALRPRAQEESAA